MRFSSDAQRRAVFANMFSRDDIKRDIIAPRSVQEFLIEHPLMTSKSVAERLGVSPTVLRDVMKEHSIAKIDPGYFHDRNRSVEELSESDILRLLARIEHGGLRAPGSLYERGRVSPETSSLFEQRLMEELERRVDAGELPGFTPLPTPMQSVVDVAPLLDVVPEAVLKWLSYGGSRVDVSSDEKRLGVELIEKGVTPQAAREYYETEYDRHKKSVPLVSDEMFMDPGERNVYNRFIEAGIDKKHAMKLIEENRVDK